MGGALGWSAKGKTLVPMPCGQDKKPVGRSQRILEEEVPG